MALVRLAIATRTRKIAAISGVKWGLKIAGKTPPHGFSEACPNPRYRNFWLTINRGFFRNFLVAIGGTLICCETSACSASLARRASQSTFPTTAFSQLVSEYPIVYSYLLMLADKSSEVLVAGASPRRVAPAWPPAPPQAQMPSPPPPPPTPLASELAPTAKPVMA